MKKYNTSEKLGTLLAIIGFVLYLSKEFYPIESISGISNYGDLIVIFGVLIAAYGRWRRLKVSE